MHVSVLYEEVLKWIEPLAEELFIDGTLGWGGHTGGILEASSPTGKVLSFDLDSLAIEEAKKRLGGIDDLEKRATFVHSSYAEMGQIAPAHGFEQVDGIVLDLGLSSIQLDTPDRGFSFRFDAPLDMRFNQSQSVSAATMINNLSEEALADIFWRYGEEKYSRNLARLIVQSRPIATTKQLADLIASATPARGRNKNHRRVHPATKVFQALRIAVNDELGSLERVLPIAVNLLKPGGRLAIISFHSLEDRLVKQTFRDMANDCICPIQQPICTCDHRAIIKLPVRKAIKPTDEEIGRNPRSRSARLRIAEKL